MLNEKINEIIHLPGVVITHDKDNCIKGNIIDPQTQKKTKFRITWGDGYAALTIIKGKDDIVVKAIAKALSIDYIKGEVNNWTGKEILYLWYEKEEKRKETLHSLQVGCAMNSGIFSFLGWQYAELLSA